jgi:hypothetical protein
MSRDSKRKAPTAKKSPWWKKSKDKKEDKIQEKKMPPPLSPPPHVTTTPQIAPTHFDERSVGASPASVKKVVHSIPPPPRLPEDIFESGFSSLDSDMFKNFK